VSDRSGTVDEEAPKKRRSGTMGSRPAARRLWRYGAHYHVAEAPKPWRRSTGRCAGRGGAQRWTTVLVPAGEGRWTEKGRRPAERKRSRAAAKLRSYARERERGEGGSG